MFTAQNAQMFFYQIGYKGTTKNAHTQVKRAKVYFWTRFSCIWAAWVAVARISIPSVGFRAVRLAIYSLTTRLPL